METPLTPSLPTPSRQEPTPETQLWRRSLLDVFRHIYKCVYKDIRLVQVPIGGYILTNSDSDPLDTLTNGTWTLDKTDGDGVRFWRRTA